VVSPGKPFQPCLICEKTRLERLAGNKRSSLFGPFAN
jgi:hypothetical protein